MVEELLNKLEQYNIIDFWSVFHFIFDVYCGRKRWHATAAVSLQALAEELNEIDKSESDVFFRKFLTQRIEDKIKDKKAEFYDSTERLQELDQELEDYRKILFEENLLDNEQMVKIIDDNFTVYEIDKLNEKLNFEIDLWYKYKKEEKIRAIMDEAKKKGVYDKLKEEIFNKIKSDKIPELERERYQKEERTKNIPKEIEDLKKFTEEISTISIKDLKSGYSIDVERLCERISNFIDEKTYLLDFLKKESYEKINLEGLEYISNENGVIFLTGLLVAKGELPLRIKEIHNSGYPDMEATYYTKDGWKPVSVEFEYQSSNFPKHNHDPNQCDMIICWEHDWSECPKNIEVIELKKFIPKQDI